MREICDVKDASENIHVEKAVVVAAEIINGGTLSWTLGDKRQVPSFARIRDFRRGELRLGARDFARNRVSRIAWSALERPESEETLPFFAGSRSCDAKFASATRGFPLAERGCFIVQ